MRQWKSTISDLLLRGPAQSLKPVKLLSYVQTKKKHKQQLPTLLAQQCLELLRPFARILNCEVFRYPPLLCTAEKAEPLRPIFSVIFYYLIYRIIKASIFQIWSTLAGSALKFMPIENGEIF